jgi:hypothetical protein
MNDIEDSQVFDLLEGGEKINMFDTGDEPLGPTGDRYEISPEIKESNTDNIHTALMALGMAPGIGIFADIADSILFAWEGEHGSAALSMAAAVPIVGQFVTAKKALKASEKAGDKMVTLFHGVDDWYKSRAVIKHSSGASKIVDTGQSMVKHRKFVGAGKWVKPGGPTDSFWVTGAREHAEHYVRGKGYLLEFQVPEKFYFNNFRHAEEGAKYGAGYFPLGLPVDYLVKVHK